MSWFVLLLTITAPAELRFEAEEHSTPTDAWLRDESAPDKWTLWSTDVDAAKKWSGGKVLRAPVAVEDRATPEAGAPALHTFLTGVPAGTYDVELPHLVRSLGYSLDGRTWRPIREGGVIARGVRVDGTYELWVDDKYAHPDHPGPGYYDYVLLRRAEDAARAIGLAAWFTRWTEVG